MRETRTECTIQAPAERVWGVLIDFPGHARWNPYVREWQGEARVGARMHLVAMPGGKPMHFHPRVIEVEPARRLRYIHRVAGGLLLRADHRIEIEPLGRDACRLAQIEEFRGLLVPFIWGVLQRQAAPGFEAMNQALKQAAESGA